jgi:hypothetical protein
MAHGTVESEVHSLLTSALNKVSSQLQILAASPRRKQSVPTEMNAGWSTEVVRTLQAKEKYLPVHYSFRSQLINL